MRAYGAAAVYGAGRMMPVLLIPAAKAVSAAAAVVAGVAAVPMVAAAVMVPEANFIWPRPV